MLYARINSFIPEAKTFVYPYCIFRAYVRKKGRNNVSVDDLVQVITPKGRGSFSLSILEVVATGCIYHKLLITIYHLIAVTAERILDMIHPLIITKYDA